MSLEKEELEWTEEEARALRRLPREQPHSFEMEERTVELLRRRGLIGGAGRRQAGWIAWATAAVAALAAAFLGGMYLGQRTAAIDAVTFLKNESELLRASARVQQTAGDYARALEALGRLATRNADPDELSQAREVAASALYAAAYEVVRLNPDDPVAVRILQGFDRPSDNNDPDKETKKVLWF